MRLIDGEQLYNELQELEDLAMKRQLDTPSTINGALSPMYIRYSAQTNERTALKYKVADAPTIPAIPMERIKQLREEIEKLPNRNPSYHYPDDLVDREDTLELIDDMIKEYEP